MHLAMPLLVGAVANQGRTELQAGLGWAEPGWVGPGWVVSHGNKTTFASHAKTRISHPHEATSISHVSKTTSHASRTLHMRNTASALHLPPASNINASAARL